MSKIILAMGCDPHYVPRAQIYLETVERFSQADENRFYMVDVAHNDYLKFPKVIYKNIDPSKFKAPIYDYRYTLQGSVASIQHGEFLIQDSFNLDDIIIFTDCDMRMQRWFHDDELQKLQALKQDEIWLVRNASLTGVVPEYMDTLSREYSGLSPTISFEALAKELGEEDASIANYKAYNAGVIICRFATYRRLFYLYSALLPLISNCFKNFAKGQWMLCYLANKYFKVLSMPPSIHVHGFGLPPCPGHDWVPTDSTGSNYILEATGHSVQNGMMCMGGIPAIFWHCW